MNRLVSVFFIHFLCFVFCVTTAVSVNAQDKADEAADREEKTIEATKEEPAKGPGVVADFVESEEEAKALGPKNAEFMALEASFREIAKTLTHLKRELPKANEERQKEIEKEYTEILAKGTELHKKMLAVGLEALDEAPNRNPPILNFLYGMVNYEFGRENYEEVVRIFKSLVAHQIVQGGEPLYAWAALSAIITLDTEDADAWLKVCEEHGILADIVEQWNKSENGRKLSFAYGRLYAGYDGVRKDWEVEKAKRAEEAKAGEEDATKKLPRVKIETTKGDIVLELFEDQAPNTVANFISLVEKGFYNGTFFHRVLPQFMAQGGCPEGTGMGGPGYMIDCETKKPDARKHFRGTISMANAGPNTNGSQFFLTFVPTTHLNGGHTVFGRVVEGMDVLSDLQRVDPSDEEAIIPVRDKIVKAEVLNKRDHEYVPVKNGKR